MVYRRSFHIVNSFHPQILVLELQLRSHDLVTRFVSVREYLLRGWHTEATAPPMTSLLSLSGVCGCLLCGWHTKAAAPLPQPCYSVCPECVSTYCVAGTLLCFCAFQFYLRRLCQQLTFNPNKYIILLFLWKGFLSPVPIASVFYFILAKYTENVKHVIRQFVSTIWGDSV